MNETVRNYLWWVAAIGLLIVPPILVRTQPGGAIRVVAYLVLIAAVFVLCLYLGLRRGPIVANLPIAKTLKTDQSRKIAEAIFRGVPFIIAIVVFVVLVEIIPSVISYAFDPSSAKVEIHKIAHVNSAAMPGAFYIRMGIHTDDNQDLSYWYPDQILQTGGTYSFTLLPNSDFVLKAQLIE